MKKPGKRRKERVLVGILAHDGNINISLGLMLYFLPSLSQDPAHPFSYEFCPMECTRPQELARNQIIGAFLKSNCDILWQIDNDMIFRGQETFRLLATPEYDIAAPLMFMFRELPALAGVDQCVPCAGLDDKPYGKYGRLWPKIMPMWPADTQSQEVDWVGSGCMLTRRHVLEDSRMLLAVGQDPPAVFRNVYAENGERISGLDTDFCRRAKGLGYRIKVNWGATIGHYKTVDLNMVDTYAKAQFHHGYKIGDEHGYSRSVRVDGEPGGAGNGSAGVAGHGPIRPAGVAAHRLDSTSGISDDFAAAIVAVEDARARAERQDGQT